MLKKLFCFQTGSEYIVHKTHHTIIRTIQDCSEAIELLFKPENDMWLIISEKNFESSCIVKV